MNHPRKWQRSDPFLKSLHTIVASIPSFFLLLESADVGPWPFINCTRPGGSYKGTDYDQTQNCTHERRHLWKSCVTHFISPCYNQQNSDMSTYSSSQGHFLQPCVATQLWHSSPGFLENLHETLTCSILTCTIRNVRVYTIANTSAAKDYKFMTVQSINHLEVRTWWSCWACLQSIKKILWYRLQILLLKQCHHHLYPLHQKMVLHA